MTLPCAIIWLATGALAPPQMAIIIDDLGYNLARAERAMALPGPPTAAVLPFATESLAIADYAHRHGVDVILHQPMESVGDAPEGPGTLKSAMTPAELSNAFSAALDSLPDVVGVSNHEGSLLTAEPDAMALVMLEIRSRGLFFVDSRTTTETVALDVARSAGVPSIRRDVFLDNRLDAEAIAAEFERAIDIAKKRGHVVVIAHPHDVSLDFLERVLPTADAELTSVAALVESVRPLRRAALVEPALRSFELERAFVQRTADDRTKKLRLVRDSTAVQRLDVREVRDAP